MADTETNYLLTRAQDEAIAAIRADHPAASAAHRRLSLLYSAKAIIELGHDGEEVGIGSDPSPVVGGGH